MSPELNAPLSRNSFQTYSITFSQSKQAGQFADFHLSYMWKCQKSWSRIRARATAARAYEPRFGMMIEERSLAIADKGRRKCVCSNHLPSITVK